MEGRLIEKISSRYPLSSPFSLTDFPFTCTLSPSIEGEIRVYEYVYE